MKRQAVYFTVAKGVWGIRDVFVNVYLIAVGSIGHWVLLDAGLRTGHKKILRAAAELFPSSPIPDAIVLTHAHFDHVGSLKSLLAEWRVPVHVHIQETPYVTGRAAYPAPDPGAGGGLMTLLSFLFPKDPIDISGSVSVLPNNGAVACLPEWKYIHTPGHSPGHISLYRQVDRLLLAGDAFVTTRQESLWSIIRQKRRVSGPPRYFTCDWGAARHSVRALAALNPAIVATGHGRCMKGAILHHQLIDLADRFNRVAVPKHGRYVHDPVVTPHLQ